MSEASERTFADAVEWARQELSRTDFGEVRLAFIVHDGRPQAKIYPNKGVLPHLEIYSWRR